MKALSRWLDLRRVRKNQNAFRSGFEWCMSEYYIEGVSLHSIAAISNGQFNSPVTPRFSGSPTSELELSFDRGVHKALCVIQT